MSNPIIQRALEQAYLHDKAASAAKQISQTGVMGSNRRKLVAETSAGTSKTAT
jgi:hypothetical protein